MLKKYIFFAEFWYIPRYIADKQAKAHRTLKVRTRQRRETCNAQDNPEPHDATCQQIEIFWFQSKKFGAKGSKNLHP